MIWGAVSPATQRRGTAALVIAAALLDDGEQVEAVVCGEYFGNVAVLVVTDQRALAVSTRPYKPDTDSIPRTAVTEVNGWIESNRATLRIAGLDHDVVIGDIAELDHAQNVAKILRGT